MKQSDKEFLCYLICLSWDRLDDSERIRASKIIREITDKEEEDYLPDDLRPDYMTQKKVEDFRSPEGKDYSSGDETTDRREGPPDKVFYYNEGYCL